MTVGHPSVDLATAAHALRAQWDRLRPWVGRVVDDEVAGEPSILEGWSVADLVAHLGRAMDALAYVTPAPDGIVPLTLAEYLGSYAGRADDIRQATSELAERIAPNPLKAVDGYAREAFANIDALGPADRVVQARRGFVNLSDMVTSRVIELVVHGDDLARSVKRARGRTDTDPVDPEALDLVARALLRIVVARGGWALEIVDARAWMRLAAGRVPYDVDTLADALRAEYTGDAVPDLGRMLPLL